MYIVNKTYICEHYCKIYPRRQARNLVWVDKIAGIHKIFYMLILIFGYDCDLRGVCFVLQSRVIQVMLLHYIREPVQPTGLLYIDPLYREIWTTWTVVMIQTGLMVWRIIFSWKTNKKELTILSKEMLEIAGNFCHSMWHSVFMFLYPIDQGFSRYRKNVNVFFLTCISVWKQTWNLFRGVKATIISIYKKFCS